MTRLFYLVQLMNNIERLAESMRTAKEHHLETVRHMSRERQRDQSYDPSRDLPLYLSTPRSPVRRSASPPAPAPDTPKSHDQAEESRDKDGSRDKDESRDKEGSRDREESRVSGESRDQMPSPRRSTSPPQPSKSQRGPR